MPYSTIHACVYYATTSPRQDIHQSTLLDILTCTGKKLHRFEATNSQTRYRFVSNPPLGQTSEFGTTDTRETLKNLQHNQRRTNTTVCLRGKLFPRRECCCYEDFSFPRGMPTLRPKIENSNAHTLDFFSLFPNLSAGGYRPDHACVNCTWT